MGRQQSFIIQLSLIVGVVLLVGIVAMLQVSETGDTWNEQTGENTVGLAGANTGACPLQTSLYDGMTQEYEVDGDAYTVNAVLPGQGVVLTVNGESTPTLRAGESATLQSGVHVKIKSIMNTWRGKRVTFCLTPGADSPSTGITCPIDGVEFAPSNPDFLGLVGNELQIALYYQADIPYLAQKYEEAGVKKVRIILNWNNIESTNGVFNWGYVDKFNNDLSQAGIQPVAIIANTPLWASSCPNETHYQSCIAADLEEYRDFVRTAVRRYGPAGTNTINDWEIRVEANSNHGLLTKQQYVQQELNPAYAVIKQEDADAKVWGPEVVFHQNNGAYPSGGAYQWVIYTILYGDYDVFSIHQFRNLTTGYEHTKRVRQMLDAAGQQDVPLAVSAMASEFASARTEQAQAKALEDLYACVSSAGADYAMWFSGTEWPDENDPNKFGIFDYDFTLPERVKPKLAYYALKKLGNSMGQPPSSCSPGKQDLRYNAGASSLIWTPAGAYSSDGTSSLWTSGEPGRCCDQGTQCAFPGGCQNDGAFMGNYSYLCATDQDQGVIFGCTEEAVENDGQKLLGNAAYCCSKYSADYNQGNRFFHALPGQRRFGLATLDEKREITRPDYDACTDGSDNDCDGLVDAQDPDCGSQPELHAMPDACVPGEEPALVTQEFLGMGMKEAGAWLNTLSGTPYVEWMTEQLDTAGVQSAIISAQPDIISNLTVKGITPIVAVGVPIRTDGSAATAPYSDADIATWESTIRTLVRTYGAAGNNQVRDWKFHNEPNGQEYWRNTREYYTILLNRVYTIVKQEDPSARVWAPGVVYHENNKASTGYNNPDAWVNHVIANGQFDVLSVHFYLADPVEMRDVIRSIRTRLDTAGHQGVPIAITEFNAWDIWSPIEGDCPYAQITEQEQATAFARYHACVADGGADYAYWFTATDRPNKKADGTLRYPNCGENGAIRTGVFTRTPVATKLSYDALREIGVALGTATEETPPPAPQPSTGTLTANPNPCVISTDSKRCSTTISWSSSDVQAPYVQVLIDDARFACAQANVQGQKAAVIEDATRVFVLYPAKSCETREGLGDAIAKLEVRGVRMSTDTAQKSVFTTTIARAAVEEK